VSPTIAVSEVKPWGLRVWYVPAATAYRSRFKVVQCLTAP